MLSLNLYILQVTIAQNKSSQCDIVSTGHCLVAASNNEHCSASILTSLLAEDRLRTDSHSYLTNNCHWFSLYSLGTDHSRRHHFQEFCYCRILIYCCRNVFTKLSPSNGCLFWPAILAFKHHVTRADTDIFSQRFF